MMSHKDKGGVAWFQRQHKCKACFNVAVGNGKRGQVTNMVSDPPPLSEILLCTTLEWKRKEGLSFDELIHFFSCQKFFFWLLRDGSSNIVSGETWFQIVVQIFKKAVGFGLGKEEGECFFFFVFKGRWRCAGGDHTTNWLPRIERAINFQEDGRGLRFRISVFRAWPRLVGAGGQLLTNPSLGSFPCTTTQYLTIIRIVILNTTPNLNFQADREMHSLTRPDFNRTNSDSRHRTKFNI